MNYAKIQSTIEAIEASGKQYFEFKSPDLLMLHFGLVNPDPVATMVFEAAWKEGGCVLPTILRQLELKELGVNCQGADYWINKIEAKYTPKTEAF